MLVDLSVNSRIMANSDRNSMSQDSDNMTLTSNDSSLSSSSVGNVSVDRDRLKMALIETYGSEQHFDYCKATMHSINSAVRKELVPRMKFVSGKNQFGQFNQPDFSDRNCWVHRVFRRLGNLNSVRDTKKAEIWMTYLKKIREQFSLHRSSVTSRLKTEFENGKCQFSLFLEIV
jgi:hypothetical protein